MQIIDTKPIMLEIKEVFKEELKKFHKKPKFVVVSVGNNVANEKYVYNKLKHCTDVGIDVVHSNLSRTINENELINHIINMQMECDSIILQLPVDCNNKINIERVLSYIAPSKDVDGLTIENQGRSFTGNPLLVPATPKAVVDFIDKLDYDLTGKDVLVLGRSTLLGNSLAQLLMRKNATVTMAHSHSNVDVDCKDGHYDVVISCVGSPHAFSNILADIIIDCGINFKDGHMVGDVDIDTCDYIYASIPPNKNKGIYGGIGSLTCMALISNIIKSYKTQGGI